MGILVYEYLEIEPTEDVQQLLAAHAKKAAIINSAENLEQSAERKKEFIRFSAEFFALIQEPKNLARYFEAYRSHHLDQASREYPMVMEGTELVRVFVQVRVYHSIDPRKTKPEDWVMQLEKYNKLTSREEFDQQFDLERLAATIRFRSANYISQVGTTAAEVETIVNLHKHDYCVLIVQILVPRACLSDTRQTEHQQDPYRLDDQHDSNYYWLKMHTQVQATDIISISAMENYENSRPFTDDFSTKELWPKNHILVVKNGFELTQQVKKSLMMEGEAAVQSMPVSYSTTSHVRLFGQEKEPARANLLSGENPLDPKRLLCSTGP